MVDGHDLGYDHHHDATAAPRHRGAAYRPGAAPPGGLLPVVPPQLRGVGGPGHGPRRPGRRGDARRAVRSADRSGGGLIGGGPRAGRGLVRPRRRLDRPGVSRGDSTRLDEPCLRGEFPPRHCRYGVPAARGRLRIRHGHGGHGVRTGAARRRRDGGGAVRADAHRRGWSASLACSSSSGSVPPGCLRRPRSPSPSWPSGSRCSWCPRLVSPRG